MMLNDEMWFAFSALPFSLLNIKVCALHRCVFLTKVDFFCFVEKGLLQCQYCIDRFALAKSNVSQIKSRLP